MVAAAHIYAKRWGLHVFPTQYPNHHVVEQGGETVTRRMCSCQLGAKCKRMGKHPASPNGFKDATTDPVAIERLWGRDQAYNVAIRTGVESGMFAVDIDAGKGGEATFEAIVEKHGALPHTVTVLTGGGGLHYYFRHPGGAWIPTKTDALGPGVDIRGDGGYVCAPPSVHASGNLYRYEASSRIDEIPIADAPPWLLDLVKEKPRVVKQAGEIDESKFPPLDRRVARARAWLAKAEPAIEGQGGHNATFQAAAALVRGFALPNEVALQILREDYNPRCDPPWDDDDLQHKVESAETKSERPRGYLLALQPSREPQPREEPRERDMTPPPDDEPPADFYDRILGSQVAAAPAGRQAGRSRATGGRPAPSRAAREPGDDDDGEGGPPPPPPPGGDRRPPTHTFITGDHTEYGQAIIETLGDVPFCFDEGMFWRYTQATGTWEKVDRALLQEMAFDLSFSRSGSVIQPPGADPKQVKMKDSDVRGTISAVQSYLGARCADGRQRRFSQAREGVAFRNGFLVVRRGAAQLVPHSPDHMCRHAFDFDYDPGAAHPRMDSVFYEVFANVKPEERRDRIRLLQEFIGTCLIGEATKYQKCLVMYGEGNNGKSQIIEIARAAFPGPIANLPPQYWGKRFQTLDLVGKLANLCDEIPDRDVTDGNVFKSMISGDPQHLDIKNQSPTSFRPRCGHIFSANKLPGTVDHSMGFWRRFIVVTFDRDMSQLPDGITPDIGKLVAEAERPGIVAWAIEGAIRAQAQRGYTVPAGSTASMEEWRNSVDPIRMWVCGEGRPYLVQERSSSSTYALFREWSRGHGFAEMSITTFGHRMKTSGVVKCQRNKLGMSYWIPGPDGRPVGASASQPPGRTVDVGLREDGSYGVEQEEMFGYDAAQDE